MTMTSRPRSPSRSQPGVDRLESRNLLSGFGGPSSWPDLRPALALRSAGLESRPEALSVGVVLSVVWDGSARPSSPVESRGFPHPMMMSAPSFSRGEAAGWVGSSDADPRGGGPPPFPFRGARFEGVPAPPNHQESSFAPMPPWRVGAPARLAGRSEHEAWAMAAPLPGGPLAVSSASTVATASPGDSRGGNPASLAAQSLATTISAPTTLVGATSSGDKLGGLIVDAAIPVPVERVADSTPAAVESAEAWPTRDSGLLLDFQPGAGGTLGATVDRFLEQLGDLGVELSGVDEVAEGAVWPAVWAVAVVGLEVGRRWLRRGSGGSGPVRAAGPGGQFAGWPGSWTVRVP